MRISLDDPNLSPERFRAYLRLMAEAQLGRGAWAGIDPSDVVQQTLLDAHKDRDRFRQVREISRYTIAGSHAGCPECAGTVFRPLPLGAR